MAIKAIIEMHIDCACMHVCYACVVSIALAHHASAKNATANARMLQDVGTALAIVTTNLLLM